MLALDIARGSVCMDEKTVLALEFTMSRDEAARQAEAVASGEVTDWQQAQAEGEAWEKTQAEGSKKEGQSFGNTE